MLKFNEEYRAMIDAMADSDELARHWRYVAASLRDIMQVMAKKLELEHAGDAQRHIDEALANVLKAVFYDQTKIKGE